MNDVDNVADAGRAVAESVVVDPDADDDTDDPEVAVPVEGAGVTLPVSVPVPVPEPEPEPVPVPVPDNAESSLLQAATASKAAPSAPLRAVRRDTTA